MSIPAAKLHDACSCPKPNGTGAPPGAGEGSANVTYGGSPAHAVGDKRPCSLGPDTVVMGSPLVTVNGRRAARACTCMAHGGNLVEGTLNVRIGGPNVAGDVSRWTKACLHARAGRAKPEERMHQSYDNCGPEAVRTLVQEITGKDYREREFLEWAIDNNWAYWREKGYPPEKQQTPDPNWNLQRIDQGQPSRPERDAAIDGAGGGNNGDWKKMLDDKGVESEFLPESDTTEAFGPRAEQAVQEGSALLLPIDSRYGGYPIAGNHVVIVSGAEYDDRGKLVALYVNDTSYIGGCGVRVPIDKIRKGVKMLTEGIHKHTEEKETKEGAGAFAPVPIRVGGRRW